MEDSKITPEHPLDRIKELLETMEITINNTSLIQDNKIIFKFGEKLYRCRMPNQRERAEADDYKNRYYVKLISEGGYATRKQLKKILKDKNNIDIDILDGEKFILQTQIKEAYLDLAVLLTEQKEAIDNIKEKIKDLESKHFEICIEVSNYLSPSVEDRIEKEYIEYLTYMCTEKISLASPDAWENLWISYKEFQDDTTKLPNKAVEILAYLILNTRD